MPVVWYGSVEESVDLSAVMLKSQRLKEAEQIDKQNQLWARLPWIRCCGLYKKNITQAAIRNKHCTVFTTHQTVEYYQRLLQLCCNEDW